MGRSTLSVLAGDRTTGHLVLTNKGIFQLYWSHPTRLWVRGKNAAVDTEQPLKTFLTDYEAVYQKDLRALVTTRSYVGSSVKSMAALHSPARWQV